MSDILFDQELNDIAIEDGDLVYINLKELEAQQAVSITLRVFRGEWFANVNFGLPYLSNDNNETQLLGQKDKGLLDGYLRAAILSNDEILSIISFSSSINQASGMYTVSATLQIEGGEIEFEEEIL